MIVLNYREMKAEVLEALDQNIEMVLATCSGNRVTARTISIICQELVIWFQTDQTFLKAQQIIENPQVALAVGNLQIEGMARIVGHPLANDFFMKNYPKRHASAFQSYSHLPREVLVEVEPRVITVWKYDEHTRPFRDFLQLPQKLAYREYYDTTSSG